MVCVPTNSAASQFRHVHAFTPINFCYRLSLRMLPLSLSTLVQREMSPNDRCACPMSPLARLLQGPLFSTHRLPTTLNSPLARRHLHLCTTTSAPHEHPRACLRFGSGHMLYCSDWVTPDRIQSGNCIRNRNKPSCRASGHHLLNDRTIPISSREWSTTFNH